MSRPALLPVALATAALLAGLPARALNTEPDGSAFAGAILGIGTLAAAPGAADTTDPLLTGETFNDGVTTPLASAPPALSLQAIAERANTVSRGTVSGSATTIRPTVPGGTTATVGGLATATADRVAGTLQLAATTDSVRVRFDSNGRPVEQQVGSYAQAAAEIDQAFSVFVDAAQPTAPGVTLSLALNGVLDSVPDFGWTNGLRVTLRFTPYTAGLDETQVRTFDFEGGPVSELLTLTAPINRVDCAPGRPTCETFFRINARMEIYARDETRNSLDGNLPGLFGGETSASFAAQVQVTTLGPGTITRLDRGDSFAWVNPTSPVPEPANAALLAAGLALLAARVRRARR